MQKERAGYSIKRREWDERCRKTKNLGKAKKRRKRRRDVERAKRRIWISTKEKEMDERSRKIGKECFDKAIWRRKMRRGVERA